MSRKAILTILMLLGLSSLTIGTVTAQSSLIWNVRVYNNIYLTEPAALAYQDSLPSLAYTWGANSPGKGVAVDYFSARWGTDGYFTAGTYRFSAQADDGVRVYVDNQVVIDAFDQPRVGQVLTGDITLATGVHHIQVDYRELAGDAYLYMGWSNLVSGPAVPPAPGGSINPAVWVAQYYANPTLTGTPSLIQSEGTPSHDWGLGSPVASIPADNFSARWTSQQTLSAGNYQITVQSDDGVRVYVNGVAYINEFHLATAQTYTAAVSLGAGVHNFMIDYYEAGGVAFLNYNLTLLGSPTSSGPTATVTAFRLNVRATPDPVSGTVLTKISRGESYPILARNSDTSWYQVNVNGTVGWVSALYVTASNAQNVPVVSSNTQPLPGQTLSCPNAPVSRLVVGGYGRVTPGVGNNVRSTPTTTGARLGRIPAGGVFAVLAGPQCSGYLAWWQVNYNGLVGWTAEGFGSQYWLEPV